MGDVTAPQLGAPAGAQASVIKLQPQPDTNFSSSASTHNSTSTSTPTENLTTNSHQPAALTMAAPAITVTRSATANSLDVLSEHLSTKTCFAFVLDTTLYDHASLTTAATTAVLDAISAAHSIPVPTLEDTFADLAATHTPFAHPTWTAYKKTLIGALLAAHNIPTTSPNSPSSEQDPVTTYFRLYKQTLYTHLHPSPGVLPLLRALLKRRAKIVIAVDAQRSGCPADMASWLVEHLYLDNFVDSIVLLDSSTMSVNVDASGQSTSSFAEALQKLDVRADETVLLAGAQRDFRGVAEREGVELVVVAESAVAGDAAAARGRDGAGAGAQDVRQGEDGVVAWEVGGLGAVRDAVRMTLHERDRSVDSPRM